MQRGRAIDPARQRHIGDFSRWKDHDSYQKAFDRLLRDLKATDSKSKDTAATHRAAMRLGQGL